MKLRDKCTCMPQVSQLGFNVEAYVAAAMATRLEHAFVVNIDISNGEH